MVGSVLQDCLAACNIRVFAGFVFLVLFFRRRVLAYGFVVSFPLVSCAGFSFGFLMTPVRRRGHCRVTGLGAQRHDVAGRD